ncbi:MAG: regulator, partial [Aliifodinibius sp.]|nr:regulator [candidate division Zixibacteria bacterium]NIT54714.1 regulator [Fodinibius sp.]NIU16680.1 regulator [candidate division Zixibacteria bacterium]NIV14663.1 regulator [Fodinibius sp.]NIY23298.1 regulator [Fodinibius sp.]
MRSFIYLMGFLFLSIPFAAQGQDFWQQTNGPPGGDVRALIVDGDDDIFAGTWGAGIFRSTDNGDLWAQVNDGLTDIYD